MLRFLKPYWKQSILLVFSIGIQAWGTLRLPTLMSQIVNQGIVASDHGFIVITGLKMVLWTVISAAGALLSSYLSARIGSAVGRDMREELFTKILSFSISEIDDFSTASLITRSTNDISTVLKCAKIRCVFVNGKTAEKYYKKYIEPQTGISAVCLPSTSPANAAWSVDKLVKTWSGSIKSIV